MESTHSITYRFLLRLWLLRGRVRDFIASLPLYAKKPRLLFIHFLICLIYLGLSAYKIHKKYLSKLGFSDPDTYGETPLLTTRQLVEELEINASDTIYDLGCGTGKIGFILHALSGCHYQGCDLNPFFINHAKLLNRFLSLPLDFSCEDMRAVELKQVSIAYLYGTLLSENFLKDLKPVFSSLAGGARLVSISQSIDYLEEELICTLEKTFICHYPWGSTQVFVYRRLFDPEK